MVAASVLTPGAATAIFRDMEQTYTPNAFCMRCAQTMFASMLCNQSERYDNGADVKDIMRYEGVCIKCCDHNHG